MVNSNPETVSTDYDTSDHLFFEPLTAEDVLNICDRMKPKGLIVQFGGQTPLNLAKALEAAGVPIIGTSVDSIDMAEDRERFQELVERLGLKQPANGTALDLQEAMHAARQIGYPVLVRPSYVLGGRAMEIVYDEDAPEALRQAGHGGLAGQADPDRQVPGVGHRGRRRLPQRRHSARIIGGVMQHIEEAGIHSGDSACVIPPHSLPAEVIDEIKRQTRDWPASSGQGADERAVRHHRSRRSEPRRASGANCRLLRAEPLPRSTSWKSIRAPAARCRSCPRRPMCRWPAMPSLVMVGKTLDELGVYEEVVPTHFSVKESVFPFNKFPGVDIILGPEMRSTGEVMGIADTFPDGVRQEPAGRQRRRCRASGTIFISRGRPRQDGRDSDRPQPGGDGLSAASPRAARPRPCVRPASRSRRFRSCRKAGRT